MSGERLQPNEIYRKLEAEKEKLKEDKEKEHYVALVKEVDGKEEIVIKHRYINGR